MKELLENQRTFQESFHRFNKTFPLNKISKNSHNFSPEKFSDKNSYQPTTIPSVIPKSGQRL